MQGKRLLGGVDGAIRRVFFLSRQITGVPDFEHEHQEIVISREHLSR